MSGGGGLRRRERVLWEEGFVEDSAVVSVNVGAGYGVRCER